MTLPGPMEGAPTAGERVWGLIRSAGASGLAGVGGGNAAVSVLSPVGGLLLEARCVIQFGIELNDPAIHWAGGLGDLQFFFPLSGYSISAAELMQ